MITRAATMKKSGINTTLKPLLLANAKELYFQNKNEGNQWSTCNYQLCILTPAKYFHNQVIFSPRTTGLINNG